MPIKVQAPNGANVEFPDGTDAATIERAMRNQFGGPQQQTDPMSSGERYLRLANSYVPGSERLTAGVGAVAEHLTAGEDNHASLGERYDRRLARERARNDAAQADPDVIGGTIARTTGLGATAIGTGGYSLLKSTLGAVPTVWQMIKEGMRIGGGVGAPTALVNTRETDPIAQAGDVLEGTIGGGVIGGTVPAVTSTARAMTFPGWRARRALERSQHAQGVNAEFDNADVPRLPVAAADNPSVEETALRLAGRPAGAPIRAQAERSIEGLEGQVRDAITDSRPMRTAAQAGEEFQDNLRHNLRGYSRSSDDLDRMSRNELESVRGAGGVNPNETYPTQFGARYRLAEQERVPGYGTARDVRGNFLDRMPERGGGPTSTWTLLNDIGKEARSTGLLKGWKDGDFASPAFWDVVRSRFGSGVGNLLQSEAERGTQANLTIPGLRRQRTLVRQVTEDLRQGGSGGGNVPDLTRLHGAMTDDLQRFLNESGGSNAALRYLQTDRAYSQFTSELRAPLRRLYGDQVTPDEAFRRLHAATQKDTSDSRLLAAFYRATYEKGSLADVENATRALLAPSMEGGMLGFMKGYSNLSPDAKNLMRRFSPDLIDRLDNLAKLAERLAPYRNAIDRGRAGIDASRSQNLILAARLFYDIPGAILAHGGPYAMARFLTSKRFADWLIRMPRAALPGVRSPAFQAHLSRIGSIASKDADIGEAVLQAVGDVLRPASAEAANVPGQLKETRQAGDYSYPQQDSMEMAGPRNRALGPDDALRRPGGEVDWGMPDRYYSDSDVTNKAVQEQQGAVYRQDIAAKPGDRRETERQSDLTNENDFEAMAKEAGFDIQAEVDKGADPKQALEKAMDAVWAKNPSDAAGELLDGLAKRYGVKPPWEREPGGGGAGDDGSGRGGGDLSGPSTRRLAGERAPAPRGTALVGPGELEDPEAAAFRPRTGMEHIPFANAAMGLAGIPVVANRSAHKAVRETGEAIERLMTRGYTPGQEDEQAVADALAASGVAATGAFAVGRPAGSLGTFIGRPQAETLAKNGRPTASRALDLAEALEAKGASKEQIRTATNNLIEENDPALGGVSKTPEGQWVVELDDSAARVRNIGPGTSTLGKEMQHPELYAADPAMRDVEFRRTSGEGGAHRPNQISVGREASSRRGVALHETQHEMDRRAGLSRGTSPEYERLRLGNDDPELSNLVNGLAIDNYYRNTGEVRARNVERRADMTAAERRATPPEETQRIPNEHQIQRWDQGSVSESRPTSVWTPERKAKLKEIYRPDGDYEQMARDLGLPNKMALINGLTRFRDELGLPAFTPKGPAKGQGRQWTAERMEELRGHLEDGKSQQAAADAMGVSLDSVENALKRWRDEAGISRQQREMRPIQEPKPPRDPFWTAERKQQFFSLYDGKRRFPEIAERMGITRKQAAGGFAKFRGELAERGYLPTGRAPANRVGGGRRAQGPLDREAMGLEAELRNVEDRMRKGKRSDEEIADAINARYKLDVTPEDIGSGNVWWRVGEQRDGPSGLVGYRDWMTPEIRLDVRGLPIPARADDKNLHRIIYADESAATADTDALERAKGLEAQGADRRKIWDQTGWWKAGDGRWLFEIDDSKAQMTPDVEAIFQRARKDGALEVPLRDILAHPLLEKAYPDLMDIPVIITKPGQRGMASDADGVYKPDEDIIYMNSGLAAKHRKPVLIHEVMHAAQVLQNRFAQNLNAPYMNRGIEAEGYNVQSRVQHNAETRRSRPPWLSFPVPEAEIDWTKPGVAKSETEAKSEPHHSTLQPRDDEGRFSGPPKKPGKRSWFPFWQRNALAGPADMSGGVLPRNSLDPEK